MNVDVAVIPCAGAGTRMRPATRVVPKSLIPIVDKPVIQYVVEEAVHAGITEIVLVVDERPGDPVLAHFVDGDPIEGLEHVTFTRTVQPEPLGLGHAVFCAADAIGDRPFMTLLSDMFPRPDRTFAPRLARVFDGRPTVAVRPVPEDFYERYGMIDAGPAQGDTVPVRGAVEKPGSASPSNLGLVGRYVFPPDLFGVLAAQDPGHGGELQLTDAIDTLARKDGALGLVVGDDLLDIGIPAGLLEATAVVGLSRADLAESFREAIAHLL